MPFVPLRGCFHMNMSTELASQPREWDLIGPAPAKPAAGDYGFVAFGRTTATTREHLIRSVQDNPAIRYVWTPDTTEPIFPYAVPFLLDAFRKNLQRKARTAILTGVALVLFAVALAVVSHEWSLVYRNLFFVFGAVVLTEGIWQYVRLRRYTAEEAASDASAARFGEWIKKKSLSGYTLALAASIIVVAIAQSLSNFSVEAAGLVKPLVREGQLWRLFTATLMHANATHFFMNFFALISLSKIVEQTVQRACVPLVFVLTAAAGSVFSVLLYPNVTSVGASGGIMGLLGFITIAAHFDRTKYPPRYFRLMIEAIISIGLLGLFGFAFIDNAAHLGGLLGGLLLGWLFFKGNERWITQNKKLVTISGAVALFALTLIVAYAVDRLLVNV